MRGARGRARVEGRQQQVPSAQPAPSVQVSGRKNEAKTPKMSKRENKMSERENKAIEGAIWGRKQERKGD